MEANAHNIVFDESRFRHDETESRLGACFCHGCRYSSIVDNYA